MSNESPEWRRDCALSDIRYLTREINHHDHQASQLRKDREKAKAKLARAKKAIEQKASKLIFG